jgi:holo-[acyl-carrier protein] synthase
MHQNVRAVDLANAQQTTRMGADGFRDLAPRVRCERQPEEPRSVREDMARERLERPANQPPAGSRFHPGERVARLRQYDFFGLQHLVIMPNIVGLGFDATDIARIAATIERYGDRFQRRIFTSGEIAYCTRRRVPAIHFAGRFAAKEAAMKALGTGRSRGVLWRDIEVVRHGGPPQLRFHGLTALPLLDSRRRNRSWPSDAYLPTRRALAKDSKR